MFSDSHVLPAEAGSHEWMNSQALKAGSAPLEELDRTFVMLGGGPAPEGAQIPPPAGLQIPLREYRRY